MKTYKIIYWTATILFCLMMLSSGLMYFISPEVKAEFVKIGFPDFFRVELGVAKILGAIVLLLPMIGGRIKEWAYAGFGIVVISALITNISLTDSAANTIMPLVAMVILVLSYLYYHKIKGSPAQSAS